jgi:hypothetical protein
MEYTMMHRMRIWEKKAHFGRFQRAKNAKRNRPEGLKYNFR